MNYIAISIVYLLLAVVIQIIFKINLWSDREKKTTIIWLTFIFLFGLLTDYYASITNRIWIFPGNGIVGIRFFTLPAEEYLFLLTAPYFALVLYKTIIKLFSANK
jgi:lycopene cyclase domain-containing protein